MKNPIRVFSLLSGTLLICLAASMFSGCAQFDQYSKNQKRDNLETKIYQFNKRLEGKMMDLSAAYLPTDKRRQFMIDSLRVKENVLFYNSEILDVQLFDGDLPVQFNPEDPKSKFNKAVVTMRYQLAVLPSNRVKTLLVDQLWLWDQQDWFVVPELEEFFK